MDNHWGIMDLSTQANFFSAIAVLPRSVRKSQLSDLYNFPIIPILQYIHQNAELRTKLPELVVGWLEIFSEDQINSLVSVLIEFVAEQQNKTGNRGADELLLYSCYSLNKIVVYKGNMIMNIGAVLHQVFPIAIRIFSQTENP